MRVGHVRDEADPGREEAGILARAVDRFGEIAFETAADGRDVDADLFEHLALHHPAHPAAAGIARGIGAIPGRSEEHTSELQSLMRKSYAGFCLQQKYTNWQ